MVFSGKQCNPNSAEYRKKHISICPGFGQDRVNFSPEARRGHSLVS